MNATTATPAVPTTATPTYDIDVIKRELGAEPFAERLDIDGDGYCKCPFHDGESDKSFHIVEKENGIVVGTCFSECGKTWDAVSFVEKFDDITRGAAIRKLGAIAYAENVTGSNKANILANPDGTHGVQKGVQKDAQKQKASGKTVVPLTLAQWEVGGRAVTDEDVAVLAASRSHSMTPSAATLNDMGFKVSMDDKGLLAPYRLGNTFYSVKKRNLTEKSFAIWNAVSMQALFNIDAVQRDEDVYVVEGELDAAVLHEMGYIAVSVTNAQQKSLEIEMIQKLKTAKRIFLVGDSDSAGVMCMDKIAAILPPEKTHRLTLTDGKDVGEMALHLANNTMLGTFQENFNALTETATASWVTQNIPYVWDIPHEEMEWVVANLLPKFGILMLAGQFGSMKSLLAFELARCIATGTPFFGRAVSQSRPVLYLDRENDKVLVGSRRLGLDVPANAVRYWGEWEESGIPALDDPKLLEFAAKDQGVIIIDSLVDWLNGADENNASEMADITAKIRRLARLGAGVVILHHSDKYGKSGYRGSTAIPAGFDMAVHVSKTVDNILELRRIKFRACGDWEMDVKIDFGTSPYTLTTLKDKTASQAVKDTFAEHMLVAKSVLKDYHDENEGAGISQRQFVNLLHAQNIKRERAEAILAKGIKEKVWRVEAGKRNGTANLYHLNGWAESVASGQAAQQTFESV